MSITSRDKRDEFTIVYIKAYLDDCFQDWKNPTQQELDLFKLENGISFITCIKDGLVDKNDNDEKGRYVWHWYIEG